MTKKIVGKAKSETHEMTLFEEAGLYSLEFDGIIALNPTSAKEAKAKWNSYLLNYAMTETAKPEWPKPKVKAKTRQPTTPRGIHLPNKKPW